MDFEPPKSAASHFWYCCLRDIVVGGMMNKLMQEVPQSRRAVVQFLAVVPTFAAVRARTGLRALAHAENSHSASSSWVFEITS